LEDSLIKIEKLNLNNKTAKKSKHRTDGF